MAVHGSDLIKLGYKDKEIVRAFDYLLDVAMKEKIVNEKEKPLSISPAKPLVSKANR